MLRVWGEGPGGMPHTAPGDENLAHLWQIFGTHKQQIWQIAAPINLFAPFVAVFFGQMHPQRKQRQHTKRRVKADVTHRYKEKRQHTRRRDKADIIQREETTYKEKRRRRDDMQRENIQREETKKTQHTKRRDKEEATRKAYTAFQSMLPNMVLYGANPHTF